jgi:hypothetical protein
VNNWQISSSASSVVATSGLTLVTSGSTRTVKPTNSATHNKYSFYVKVTASGNSFYFFGPYYLDVGCTSTSVTFTDAANFATNGVAKLVGDSTASVYTLNVPTSSLTYCVITSSVIV